MTPKPKLTRGDVKDHWHPVRRCVFVEGNDLHGDFTGPIVIEMTPEGFRWWWDDGSDHAPDDAQQFTMAQMVKGCFRMSVLDLEEDVRYCKARLEQAEKRSVAIRRAMRSKPLVLLGE